MSYTGDYLFAVKEGAGPDTAYILLEPHGGGIPAWENALVYLELENPNYHAAQKVAEFLNQHIKSVGFQPE